MRKIIVFLFLIINSCQTKPVIKSNNETIIQAKPVVFTHTNKCDRSNILENIATKNTNKIPLVVHVFIPLCDNENQGIVKVPEVIGNGFDARNNLYWGAAYGLKTYFKKQQNWQLITATKNPLNNVLERVIFKTTNKTGNTVYLIADAYRGDKIKACVEQFFKSGAGISNEALTIENQQIGIYGKADLVVFNGHNALMDVDIKTIYNKTETCNKDAMVIACQSQKYFNRYLLQARTYPLLCTSNFMAPEAYVIEKAITKWANSANETDIKEAAAQAYNKYQKCGIKGARNLFTMGW